MISVATVLLLLSISAIILSVGAGLQAHQSGPAAPGHRPSHVDRVTLNAKGETLLGGLLHLGIQQKVPIGVECVDRELVTKRLNGTIGPMAFGDVLSAVLSKARGFYWREYHGVVLISCSAMSRQQENMLNFVISRFTIPQCTMGEASHLLRMAVFRQLHPETAVAGDYMPGNSKSLIGPLVTQHTTVRAALDRIVALGPKGAWVVQVPPKFVGEIPARGLWRVVAYDDPNFIHVAEGTRQSILRYSRK